MAGDYLTARSDLHPYDCGGEEEKCQHCLKTATPQHDSATCALCHHDLAEEGREAVEAELAETARVTAADVLRCRDHGRSWCIDCEPAGGWPKRLPQPAESEHLYIGAATCGCVLFACIDTPENRSDTAKEVAACVRQGLVVSRVPNPGVSPFTRCAAHAGIADHAAWLAALDIVRPKRRRRAP